MAQNRKKNNQKQTTIPTLKGQLSLPGLPTEPEILKKMVQAHKAARIPEMALCSANAVWGTTSTEPKATPVSEPDQTDTEPLSVEVLEPVDFSLFTPIPRGTPTVATFHKILLTINNPDKYGVTPEGVVTFAKTHSVDYYCLSLEISPSGTKHMHVFFYRKNSLRYRTVVNAFPTAHIDFCRGKIFEIVDYIAKRGKWAESEKAETSIPGSFVESGPMPDEPEQAPGVWTTARLEIEEGLTPKEITSIHPQLTARYGNLEKACRDIQEQQALSHIRDELTTNYIYASEDADVMSYIYQMHAPADICYVTSYKNQEPRVDHYRKQPVLVFDNFYGQIPFPNILNYMRPWPLMLPIRYGDRPALYTTLYLVSRHPAESLYHPSGSPKQQAFLKQIDRYFVATDQELLEKKKEDVA